MPGATKRVRRPTSGERRGQDQSAARRMKMAEDAHFAAMRPRGQQDGPVRAFCEDDANLIGKRRERLNLCGRAARTAAMLKRVREAARRLLRACVERRREEHAHSWRDNPATGRPFSYTLKTGSRKNLHTRSIWMAPASTTRSGIVRHLPGQRSRVVAAVTRSSRPGTSRWRRTLASLIDGVSLRQRRTCFPAYWTHAGAPQKPRRWSRRRPRQRGRPDVRAAIEKFPGIRPDRMLSSRRSIPTARLLRSRPPQRDPPRSRTRTVRYRIAKRSASARLDLPRRSVRPNTPLKSTCRRRSLRPRRRQKQIIRSAWSASRRSARSCTSAWR